MKNQNKTFNCLQLSVLISTILVSVSKWLFKQRPMTFLHLQHKRLTCALHYRMGNSLHEGVIKSAQNIRIVGNELRIKDHSNPLP